MSTERLRDILRNSADEMDAVDLAASAMKQSRQMTVRRAAVGATLAVALLAGGIFGAANFWKGPGGGDVDVAESASPSVSATTSASPAPSGSQRAGEAAPPKEHIEGTFYYVTSSALMSWTPGSAPRTLFTAGSSDDDILGTANVSPDGRYAAWNNMKGKLRLLDLNSGDVRDLMDIPTSEYCFDPAWTSDGRILTHKEQGGRAGLYDIDARSFTELPMVMQGCHPRIVGSTAYVIGGGVDKISGYDLGTGEVTTQVSTVVGSRRALDITAAFAGPSGLIFAVTTNDADGTRGDVGRGLVGDSLFELRGNKCVDLDVESMDGGFGAQNGLMVLRQKTGGGHRVVLQGGDGVPIETLDEPDGLGEAYAIAYNP